VGAREEKRRGGSTREECGGSALYQGVNKNQYTLTFRGCRNPVLNYIINPNMADIKLND
jgi:hypothetical protein